MPDFYARFARFLCQKWNIEENSYVVQKNRHIRTLRPDGRHLFVILHVVIPTSFRQSYNNYSVLQEIRFFNGYFMEKLFGELKK